MNDLRVTSLTCTILSRSVDLFPGIQVKGRQGEEYFIALQHGWSTRSTSLDLVQHCVHMMLSRQTVVLLTIENRNRSENPGKPWHYIETRPSRACGLMITPLRLLRLDHEFPVARPRYDFWAALAAENLKIIHYFEKFFSSITFLSILEVLVGNESKNRVDPRLFIFGWSPVGSFHS